VQKKDKSEVDVLAEVCFAAGDVLVLQANDDSPLLVRPPQDFYTPKVERTSNADKFLKAVGGLKLSSSFSDLAKAGKTNESKSDNEDKNGEDQVSVDTRKADVWNDLRVLFRGKESKDDSGSREFLAAVKVNPKSEHIGKTVAQAGLDKQLGLFLVGVERPVTGKETLTVSFMRPSVMPGQSPLSVSSGIASVSEGSEMASLTQGNMPTATLPVPPEGHLKEGDVLWFAGSAVSIADLRKIPGLTSLEDDELKQIDEKLHDRRLVQAVVARKGPLCGKTAG